jgi:DNA-nicking Smr family endonuclease
MDTDCWNEEESVTIPVDGMLDLHAFRPAEVRELVPAYLEECRNRGILSVRIVHGKGKGALRRSVHAILDRIPAMIAYRLAGPEGGGWGATLVELSPL